MKITYLINDVKKSLTFEELFLELKSKQIDFHVVLILNEVNSPLFQFCKAHDIDCTELLAEGKKKRFLAIYKFLKKNPTKIVHTHLFETGLLGGFAAWILRIPKRVYTRHHGDQHLYEHPHALKYDKWINFFHTDIICLSKPHLKQIKTTEKPKANLHLLPHAYNPKSLDISNERIIAIKEKYEIDADCFNVMVNARWTEWKGVHFIIDAFGEFLVNHPNSKLWLFNCTGDYSEIINEKLSNLPQEKYAITIFESDILPVFKNMNIFVHVPIRNTAESFGQVYIEAMGLGLPCVFTLSGIAEDIVIDGENALVVNYENKNDILEKLVQLKNNDYLCKKISLRAINIIEYFSLENHILKLLNIYK